MPPLPPQHPQQQQRPEQQPGQQQEQAQPEEPILALAEAGEIVEVTNETPAAARADLYRSQAALFITTRILVVDFLNRRLQPSQVLDLLSPSSCCSLVTINFCLGIESGATSHRDAVMPVGGCQQCCCPLSCRQRVITHRGRKPSGNPAHSSTSALQTHEQVFASWPAGVMMPLRHCRWRGCWC